MPCETWGTGREVSDDSTRVNFTAQVAASSCTVSGRSRAGGRKCSILVRPVTRTHSAPSTVSADFSFTVPEMFCGLSLYPADAHERATWSARTFHASPTYTGLSVP